MMVTPLPSPPPPPPWRAPEQLEPGRTPPSGRRLALLGTAAAVVFAGGLATARLVIDDDQAKTPIVIPTTSPGPIGNAASAVNEPGVPDAHGPIDVFAVASAVAPSVVTISADITGGFQGGEAVGTGVIVSAEGEILTNAHVVDGASEVRIGLAGNTEPIVAEIVATDSGNDLALLRVDVGAPLPAVEFASSEDIRLGDDVVAIGFALDLDGEPTVTRGIVAALGRTLAVPEGGALDGLTQTDAAIVVEVDESVVEVDESVVTGSAGVVAAIRDRSPGEQISVVVMRSGEPVTLVVTLAERQ